MQTVVSYQGGKGRLAPAIANFVNPSGAFYEICCGGGSVTLELLSRGVPPEDVTMVDAGPWGDFWSLVGSGGFDCDRLDHVVRQVPEDRSQIKAWVMDAWGRVVPDVYWFLLFQSASFGGSPVYYEGSRWTKSGGWRSYWQPTATSNRRSPVNPMMPMPLTLASRVRRVCALARGVTGIRGDAASAPVSPQSTVYIDPPYEGFTGYEGQTLDVIDLTRRLRSSDVWVSEARPLGPHAHELSSGRKKGGVSGRRAKANAEWLTHFGPREHACTTS